MSEAKSWLHQYEKTVS